VAGLAGARVGAVRLNLSWQSEGVAGLTGAGVGAVRLNLSEQSEGSDRPCRCEGGCGSRLNLSGQSKGSGRPCQCGGGRGLPEFKRAERGK
jgi:hypothetical protein